MSLGVNTQAPFAKLQVSVVQVSGDVQSFPSSQYVRPVLGVFTQAPVTGSHESVVQTLPSSQFFGVCAHVPSGLQVSVLQGFPSSHTEPNSLQSLAHEPGK